MISPEQIRGARAMLGLTQARLAAMAGVSTTGLNNIERGTTDPKASTLRAIQAALEAAGVVFLDATNGEEGGAGVRLRKHIEAPETIVEKIAALEVKAEALKPEPEPPSPAKLKAIARAKRLDRIAARNGFRLEKAGHGKGRGRFCIVNLADGAMMRSNAPDHEYSFTLTEAESWLAARPTTRMPSRRAELRRG